MPTIGLVMVVKDEANTIRRCLESIKPLVDHFTVVVDGSTTDNTAKVVEETLMGLSGRIYTKPWLGFSKSRNAAIALAEPHTDYLLTCDADDLFEYTKGYRLPKLDLDRYNITIEEGALSYYRTMIWRGGLGIHYEGVAHEVLVGGRTEGHLTRIVYRRTQDGASWRDSLSKNHGYALALESDFTLDPTDMRACFYAAQSWRDVADAAEDLGQPADEARRRAVGLYRKRVVDGNGRNGHPSEVFLSHCMIGNLLFRLGDHTTAIETYKMALRVEPTRAAEPAHDLAVILSSLGRHLEAYEIGKPYLALPIPEGAVCLRRDVYVWRLLHHWALAAWWAGHKDEARAAWKHLLTTAPPEEHESLRRNLTY